MLLRFGILGGGSWATALAKILTDNRHSINWWIRNDDVASHLKQRRHNPHYLSSVYFDTSLLNVNNDIRMVVENSDILVVAVPSAFIEQALQPINDKNLHGKKIVSAIKGILPAHDILLNQYLEEEFEVALDNYFAVLGPCHAEEVAAEKLSYLTFSGIDVTTAEEIASHFKSDYINTIVNHDILGVQYAAVLKNIYALG